MISLKSGFNETILLIPGWAADHRIFKSLDLDFNYILPDKFTVMDFEEELLEHLEKAGLEKISILGSSMGGFLAADFASKHPERVNSLTLIGMRKRYDKDGLETIKRYLKTNKTGYLHKFYHECFSSEEKECLSVFKRGLMKDYLKELSMDELLGGLDYLGRTALDLSVIDKVKTRFIHGDADKIAPIKDIAGVGGLTVLKGAGHIPFLRSDFKKVFYEDENR
jgi:pimeloyl-ACP methyl ester carboxylesterase